MLPVVLPVVVLLTMAALVGAVALSLLYNTHYGSLMLAAVAAAGILFTVSLASSQERLGGPKRTVVLLAAAVPLLIGGAVGFGLIGGVDDADRMINVQPLIVVPDDAPIIAAENSLEFCIGQEGSCEPIDVWDVVPSQQTDTITFLFDNREVGVQHNVVITDLAGEDDDPQPGSTTYATTTLVAGPAVEPYVSSDLTWNDLPEQWYFFCAIHPNMQGVGQVVAE
ncbi:MAG: hypothetical protein WD576_01975 [Nitriliruptoraceae bacterium]